MQNINNNNNSDEIRGGKDMLVFYLILSPIIIFIIVGIIVGINNESIKNKLLIKKWNEEMVVQNIKSISLIIDNKVIVPLDKKYYWRTCSKVYVNGSAINFKSLNKLDSIIYSKCNNHFYLFSGDYSNRDSVVYQFFPYTKKEVFNCSNDLLISYTYSIYSQYKQTESHKKTHQINCETLK